MLITYITILSYNELYIYGFKTLVTSCGKYPFDHQSINLKFAEPRFALPDRWQGGSRPSHPGRLPCDWWIPALSVRRNQSPSISRNHRPQMTDLIRI